MLSWVCVYDKPTTSSMFGSVPTPDSGLCESSNFLERRI